MFRKTNMLKNYKHLITPLLSLIILTLGSALLTTFLSLKLDSLNTSEFLIGGLTTAYYAGMVLGAFKLEGLILRVGHIRAYSAFASMLAVFSILHGFYVDVYFWLLLRFLGGIATAGLYIVIESWILSATDNKNRGGSLALYMIALYVAQAGGQWLLNIGDQDTLILYCIAAVFASLSVIPLALTRTTAPIFSEPETLSIGQMIKLSPSGVSTCFVSGMILGSIYGLYPIFIQNSGYPTAEISIIMGLTIFGGMVFQYPFGRLSDLISRRYVIAFLALMSSVLCVAIIEIGKDNVYIISILSFLLGGTTFCLYPIGISHTCDRINNNQIVSASQTLLLSYGLGATFGPIIAPLFNIVMVDGEILVFIMVMSLPLCLFMLWRKQISASVPMEDKHSFVPATEITPVTNEMDPRADEGQ
ncbi:putative MFS-type transporter YcaD (plasmid) [Piscirickettsia salmonis]|uniref:Major Facilitator Superfamily protein n=3 Tax=Bacteria TaxID=2 RepID=A0AAC8VL24_PISSA|nr:MFS transporter [Piscirickettsia salmonis]AKP75056.1 hypothetical protein PSLF89_3p38 [Piscirickettsia salmonis LF-89 = ATCC VR-1361]ALB24462.1 major Facilitator Superfamily protein [Piscirickettsia salmonis]ALY04640.1 hypothetical protein AWE47_17200 [Piscirickettsia salmonis]AMA43957.1 hypothetical protein AWJ11_16355 [Piscirickettsia salmonis]APS62252.1 hypothetical protein AVI53_16985 [Piscirickettsia salmonis]